MAVVAIHTHPGSWGNPHFSATDDDGEAELASYLGRRGAPVPHVALVIGPEGARARILGGDEEVPVWEVSEKLVLHSPLAGGAPMAGTTARSAPSANRGSACSAGSASR